MGDILLQTLWASVIPCRRRRRLRQRARIGSDVWLWFHHSWLDAARTESNCLWPAKSPS